MCSVAQGGHVGEEIVDLLAQGVGHRDLGVEPLADHLPRRPATR
ncbi:MAG: hypothetical protein ACRD0K_10475 [Egibacteraceae bacterium]